LEQQEWVSSGADNLLCDNILQNPPYSTFYPTTEGVWCVGDL